MSHSDTYTRGERVELVHTSDEHTTLTPGAHGTVAHVDSLGTVHVTWDDGSTLGMLLDDGDQIRKP